MFYVYEYFVIETGEVFYVGKGKGKRYLETKRRNKMFIDFYRTHNCDVRIVYEGLSEEEAFSQEKALIKYYRENTDYRLTNQTEGGTGGYTLKYKTEEEIKDYRQKLSNALKGTRVGANNPMYGKSWHENKTQEEIEEIYKRVSEKNKNYKPTEETRRKMSDSARKRDNTNLYKTPRRPVIIVKKDTFEIVAMFDKISDALGNKWVGGNLSYKASGRVTNPKDEYLIFYTYYPIDGKNQHP